MSTYKEIYEFAQTNPTQFWQHAAEELTWSKPFSQVLDASRSPFYKWFSDGEINTCYNALDRHVLNGNGDRTALIYDSAVSTDSRKYTYNELLELVSHFAAGLLRQGIQTGDRVIIYMPMIPQAVIAMLACARIGAIHSVVFGGFAAKELASRLVDCSPKLIITASCGIEVQKIVAYKPLADKAIEIANLGDIPIVVYQRPECVAELKSGCDHNWSNFVADTETTDCVALNSEHPLYILYTSGTTGQPKGVVRSNGGHAVAMQWSLKNVYGMSSNDVYWAASDVGWVVGHSYIVYAPLLLGCTTVLYEGKPIGTPDAGAFWRVIEEHQVNCLFTAPTAFRAIRREDPQAAELEKYNISSLRSLFLAGERCDPDTLNWAQETLKVPVIDHWWQTETGWPVAANPLGIEELAVKPGSPTLAMPGYQVDILNDEGELVNPNDIGNIVIKLPLPPGTLKTLWGNDARYQEAYLQTFPGYYLTGDAGYKDEDDYLWIMSRIDDVINVAGHRLSTGQMEESLAKHPAVAECAVIGIQDDLKGELPLGLVVLNKDTTITENELVQELIELVRNDIGPVAAFKQAITVKRLPKTRSGKVLRKTLKKIANGEDYEVPATIDDPDILREIEECFKV